MLLLPRRRTSLLAAGFIFSTGCTTILGIDGHYVIGGPAGGAPATPDGAGVSGGGAAPIATDAAVAPPPVDAGQPLPCQEGTYTGTVGGNSAVLSAKCGGTMTFQLVRSTSDANEFDVQKGSFSCNAVSIPGVAGAGTLTASLTGVLDCRARKLTGQLVNGKATLVSVLVFSVPPTPFSGAVSADYDPRKPLFTGVWHEQGTSGGGTWTGALKGP